MSKVRVLLADDHTLVRKGFRAIIETINDIEVVGEASSGEQALQMVAELLPDILLLDVAMPGLGGLEAAARIHRDYPTVKVIILSMHENEAYVHEAFRVGAHGYLLKDADVPELATAIRAVAAGEMYLSPAISRQVIERYVLHADEKTGPASVSLTPRQLDVLRLIAEGHTTQSIARCLDISVKTVETHRAQLMERLGIYTVAGLVRYALDAGLASPHEPDQR